jgi:nitrogen regulatory protein P-II 1
MKKIEAIIRPEKLEEIKNALVSAGVSGMTVSRVDGFGHQKGQVMNYRGTKYSASFIQKVKVEVIVPADMADFIIDLIVRSAKSGQIGDGKIFVSPVTQVVRIRSNERDLAALNNTVAVV